jgi:RNA-binding protein YlmH
MENMADFLCEHITKIRHTLVSVSKVEAVQMQIRPKLKPVEGFLSSFRLDAVISLGFSLSRKESALFIKNKKVFVNGRLIENAGRQVAEGDVISVRGKGKMQFNEIRGQSKKGRYSVLLYQYV